MIKLTIPGEPKAKGRPRFARMGNFVKTYSPEITVNYENWVKQCFMFDKCDKLEGELIVKISAFFSIPSSASKSVRAKMLSTEIRPTKKPDLDNIAKILLDSLNGMAYEDDKQVVRLEVEKFYGANPRVELEIEQRQIERGII